MMSLARRLEQRREEGRLEQREGAGTVAGGWPVGGCQGGRLPIGDAQVKGGGEQRQK